MPRTIWWTNQQVQQRTRENAVRRAPLNQDRMEGESQPSEAQPFLIDTVPLELGSLDSEIIRPINVIPCRHSNLRSIGDRSQGSNNFIRLIFIPASLLVIGEGAFSGLLLEHLIFARDAHIRSVKRTAFCNAMNVRPVHISPSIMLWMEMKLVRYVNRQMAYDESQLEVIPSDAFANMPLAPIMIPASVQRIDARAFQGATIESMTFHPNSQLESIGEGSFAGCNLTAIVIPASVRTIDN